MRQNIFQRRRRARGCQRHHSLVIFRIGQPVNLPALLESHWNALLPRQLHNFFYPLVLPTLRDRDVVDGPPRLQRFLDRMYARQFVHEVESLPSPAHT